MKSFTCIPWHFVSSVPHSVLPAILVFVVLAPLPALAVSISSPGDGAQVSSPFTLRASAATCASQNVSAMGYSFDQSADTRVVSGDAIDAQVTAPTGAHVLHVKAWGNHGAACSGSLTVHVEAVAASGISVTSPAAGENVTLPYAVSAHASSCDSQAVGAMGFSLDNSPNTKIVGGTAIDTEITAGTGKHTLHIKAWGRNGAACHEDRTINVAAGGSLASSSAPITVGSPGKGEKVTSPFRLSASAGTCASQAVSAMGYSLDNSSATTILGGGSIDRNISVPAGSHTLHVKSWGRNGAGCVVDVAIDVSAGSALSGVPSSAVSVSSLQAVGNWTHQFDSGTGSGSARGSMSMVGSPSLSGHARKFATSFWKYGGERYYTSFGDDTSSTNFLYDAWVYLDGSSSQISNLEMDMNQTMPNGQTVIFGFQCDGWSGTWDYTANKGTPQNPRDTWIKSKQHCNVREWSRNTWHHVQVRYSRDSRGNVTYQSVWLDGREQTIGAKVNSAFALGWGPSLLTNLQVDELSSGSASATVYLDNLTVYRW